MSSVCRRRIRNTPAGPALARRYVEEVLDGAALDVVETAVLIVSELATNCVQYVDTDFVVSIEKSADEVRFDVADGGAGRIERRDPGPTEITGRGLVIVDRLADAWGIEERVATVGIAPGKCVWFTLRLEPARSRPRERSRPRDNATH